ncbi:MAG: hypothetical protein JWO98_5329 [Frankiales bacterium]|nr:hypothetical protein [Frankiales bacterium]
MTYLATTRADVLRGLATDEIGNEVDVDTPVDGLTNIPISLIEKSRNVYLPETDELRTIRYGIGRARPGLDIREADRLLDRNTGRKWYVNEVTGGGRTIAGFADLVLDLRTGDGPSTPAVSTESA